MAIQQQLVAEFPTLLRHREDLAGSYHHLGSLLQDQGRLDEAIAEYHKAIKLKKDYAEVHYGLGIALHDKGQLDEAIAEYHKAIELKKDFAEAPCNLGSELEQKGQFSEALVYRCRGHELGSKNPDWKYPSDQWVRNCERLVELDGKLPAILIQVPRGSVRS